MILHKASKTCEAYTYYKFELQHKDFSAYVKYCSANLYGFSFEADKTLQCKKCLERLECRPGLTSFFAHLDENPGCDNHELSSDFAYSLSRIFNGQSFDCLHIKKVNSANSVVSPYVANPADQNLLKRKAQPTVAQSRAGKDAKARKVRAEAAEVQKALSSVNTPEQADERVLTSLPRSHGWGHAALGGTSLAECQPVNPAGQTGPPYDCSFCFRSFDGKDAGKKVIGHLKGCKTRALDEYDVRAAFFAWLENCPRCRKEFAIFDPGWDASKRRDRAKRDRLECLHCKKRCLKVGKFALHTEGDKNCEKARWFVADFLHFLRVSNWEDDSQDLKCTHI